MGPSIAWELITDVAYEEADRQLMRKPSFIFGDSIMELDGSLFDTYKWLYKISE